MPHNTAFHQDLHCLLSQKLSSEKEIQLESISCDPRYIQWTILSLLYRTRRKNPLVHKGLRWRFYSLFSKKICSAHLQGPVVLSVVSPTADPGVTSLIPAWSHTLVEVDHEIISAVILLFSLIQEGLLSVTSENMYTKYWLTA